MRVVSGWLVATAAVFSGLVARRSSEIRMEAVARACHELRGPLAAARLGLELGVRVGELHRRSCGRWTSSSAARRSRSTISRPPG